MESAIDGDGDGGVWEMCDTFNHIFVIPHGISELKDNANDISLREGRGEDTYNDKQQKAL